MPYYLYILNCSNGSLYIGYTTDIARRYQEHRNGSPKCKYTRSFPPIALAACWQIDGELSQVLRLERKLKQLKKDQKQAYIKTPTRLVNNYSNFAIMALDPNTLILT